MACRRVGLRVIGTHNEQAAAYMADTYARLTGRVGVCAVSSGVTHTNALTGVANAYFDGTPMLLITGASIGYGTKRGVFQEFDQVALAAPICKFAAWVTRADELIFSVRQDFAAATTGRPGPVHPTIPLDVLESKVTVVEELTQRATRISSPGQVDPKVIGEVIRVIVEAKQPLLITGSGVFYTRGQEALIRFSEVAGIPIVIPIWDRGVVEKPHSNFLGVIGAPSGEPSLLPDVDPIILACATVDYRIDFLAFPNVSRDTIIIRIDEDIHELRQGIEPTIALPVSPTVALSQLASELQQRGRFFRGEWLKEAQERRHLFRSP